MGPPKFMCLSATAFVGQTFKPLWWIPPYHRSGFLIDRAMLTKGEFASKNSASGCIPFADFPPFSGVYNSYWIHTDRNANCEP